jgi:hypothetical protein
LAKSSQVPGASQAARPATLPVPPLALLPPLPPVALPPVPPLALLPPLPPVALPPVPLPSPEVEPPQATATATNPINNTPSFRIGEP